MLFDKCCHLLMRMVSPRKAGLILYCLIGGLSAVLPLYSPQPDLYRHSPPRYSSVGIDGSSLDLKRLTRNSTVNLPTNSTTMGKSAMPSNAPGGDAKPSNSWGSLENDIEKVTAKSPTDPPRVINTQMVYTVSDLIKFLRDTKLRISQAAKRELERKDSQSPLSSKQRIGTVSSVESVDASKDILKLNSLKKGKTTNVDDRNVGTSNKKAQATNKPRVYTFRSRKSRRNSVVAVRPNFREGREDTVVASYMSITRAGDSSNNSTLRKPRPKTLFNYTYHISAVDRGSVFPHDPLGESEEHSKKDLFPSPYIIPYISNKTESNEFPKSESIYETLKPRLRTRLPSRTEDNFWHQKLANFSPTRQHQRNETEVRVKIRADSSFPTVTPTVEALIVHSRENDNLLSIANRTDASKLGSLHVPKRMDSTHGTVRILTRQNPTVEPPLSNEVLNISRLDTDTSREHINNSILRSKKQPLNPSQAKTPSTNSSRLVLRDFKEVLGDASSSLDINSSESTNNLLLQSLNGTSRVIPTTTNSPNILETDVTELYESDIRKPKMTDTSENSENVPYKRPRLDQKSFYEYLMKSYMGNDTRNISLPEYRPGAFFPYDDIYPRKPVLDIYFPRPTPFFKVRTSPSSPVTAIPDTTTTHFESKRTSVRVSSTFYPNRMQDEVLKFGHPPDSTTTVVPEEDDDSDDAELRDSLEAGFTMEKLAYLLIGTCCGLSILCLCVVVAAIKCRRVLVEKRLRAQFRRQLYHNDIKDNPWQQQMFDHFTYLNRNLDSTRSSSCNCQCVTWTLGARNLDQSSRAPDSTNRSSLYLCGQKKLPFGAASTLRYESMLGRKRPPEIAKHESSNTDSSQENDSLEQDSDSRDEDGTPRQCTCISYTMWPMPADGRRAMYGLCTPAGHYITGDCGHQPLERMHTIPKGCPPPVTGSNYLDRSEGVVYWSSNDERLI